MKESMVPKKILEELDSTMELEQEQIDFFQKHRYIKLKHVFSSELLSYYDAIISEKVTTLNPVLTELSSRDTYGKAFIQVFNLWREDSRIKQLVMSGRLGKIASELMRVQGVRIYHDQALYKESGGGITPWHADQYYWPLDSDKTITAWIPLHGVPLEMGPLEFSAGSHTMAEGRNLEISDESEKILKANLSSKNFPHIVESFEPGEISFHSGWVFHRAGENQTDRVRKVMTVIYMDKNMKLKAPENQNQQNDWNTWCPGAKIGQIIDTDLNPVVY